MLDRLLSIAQLQVRGIVSAEVGAAAKLAQRASLSMAQGASLDAPARKSRQALSEDRATGSVEGVHDLL